MHPTVAKALVLGIPLLLSLAWFVFWVVRLARTAKRLKERGPRTPGSTPPPA